MDKLNRDIEKLLRSLHEKHEYFMPGITDEIIKDYERVTKIKSQLDNTKSVLELVNPDLTLKLRKCDFWYSCYSGKLQDVKRILHQNKNIPNFINCTDAKGYSGLDYACSAQHKDVENYLTKHGAMMTEHTLDIMADIIEKNEQEQLEKMEEQHLKAVTEDAIQKVMKISKSKDTRSK